MRISEDEAQMTNNQKNCLMLSNQGNACQNYPETPSHPEAAKDKFQ